MLIEPALILNLLAAMIEPDQDGHRISYSAINGVCSALIRYSHVHSLPHPNRTGLITRFRRNANVKLQGNIHPFQSDHLGPGDVECMCHWLHLNGRPWEAFAIAIMWCAAARIGTVAGLLFGDLELTPEYLVIRVRTLKTAVAGDLVEYAVSRRTSGAWRSPATYTDLLSESGHAEEPQPFASTHLIRRQFYRALRVLNQWRRERGLQPLRATPHSARSGSARWMYIQGVDIVTIMRHGTWTNVAQLERYIRATGKVREAKTREALLGSLQPGEAPPPIAAAAARIDDEYTQVVGDSQQRPVVAQGARPPLLTDLLVGRRRRHSCVADPGRSRRGTRHW